MRKFILSLFFIVPLATHAQTSINIDASVFYQTIHGFGASDAWNTDLVGKHWNESVKDKIAKKLFAKTFDINGNPEGIGLSRWRFNIGAGSAEQGSASNIEMPERRVECFLNEDSTYNWDKQAGQRWFLKQAKAYNVENLVAFVNSPPRFYSKSGRTNSDNTNEYGSTNLKDDYYDNFASFMTTVLKHFEDSSIHFSQISPVNEPQFSWNSGQEGCPWKNSEIKRLVNALDTAIIHKGLSTKILLAEAGSFNELYKETGNIEKSNQIFKFFTPSSYEYVGGCSQVLPGIGGHSYWTDGDDSTIKTVRESYYKKGLELGVELYQTEYNLLSKDYDDYLTNSIFLGKMIYADLSIANVSIWDYWTAMERERWGQKNRFYLIRLLPMDGDYGDLSKGGNCSIDKNLWVLGNYSLFVRPGYKRLKISGADNLAGLMGTAFISPDTTKIVVVYVNWGTSDVNISQIFSNLPDGLYASGIKSYVTNEGSNLQLKDTLLGNGSYVISGRSVTTMVVNLGKGATSLKQSNNNSGFELYPNPNNGLFQIKSKMQDLSNVPITIYNVSGNIVYNNHINVSQSQIIDITDEPSGIYLIKIKSKVHELFKI